MKIKIVNPIEYPRWNENIAELKHATIFHTSNWADVLHKTYKYKPIYVTAFSEGQIIGAVPMMEIKSAITGNRAVSLPFTDECPFIGDEPGVFDELFEHIDLQLQASNWKYAEFRGGYSRLKDDFAIGRYIVHNLDITHSEKELETKFRRSTLRNIHKANKQDVRVRQTTEWNDLNAFIQFNYHTRRRHGLPPQPNRFFKNLFKYVLNDNKGIITVATYKNKNIAGAIFLKFKDKLVYKYGASNTKYHNLRPNNLIMWEAIRWGKRNGLSTLNFGRTEPENDGLLQFKRGWGGAESVLRYYHYNRQGLKSVHSNREHTKLQSSYPVFKKLPLPLLRLFGSMVYRHFG